MEPSTAPGETTTRGEATTRKGAGQARLGLGLTAYNSVAQLQTDLWWSIANAARRLAKPDLDPAEQAEAEAVLEEDLAGVEVLTHYYSRPGRQVAAALRALASESYLELSRTAERIGRGMIAEMPIPTAAVTGAEEPAADAGSEAADRRPRFDVLVVADLSEAEEAKVRNGLRALRRREDPFLYELVTVPSFVDAMVAILINPEIQAVVVRPDCHGRSSVDLSLLDGLVPPGGVEGFDHLTAAERAGAIARAIRRDRPELDLYLVEQASVEQLAVQVGREYDSIFLQQEDVLDLHLTILRGVGTRYRTPFYSALLEYARKPTGVFHALPVSRGGSVVASPWIHDMCDFYGLNIFLAETSATAGGLDSLLEPHGTIKEAQDLASRAFGSRRTYFVTNGTSTANKIVTQALVAPGDVVLVDRNCHKSHHYAQVMAGSNVAYLDSYSIDAYAMYGAIPLSDIKRTLLTYRREGRLDQVTLISLTNCTFDGVVYDVERVMTECLAIKPDLAFLWDEAWFAFARFHPVYRRRTAMATAERLTERLRTPEYRAEYERHAERIRGMTDDELAHEPLLPDPDQVRIRAYATQSTHKTLTALRQGSVIHVHDEDFSRRTEEAFHEAYMTHTSTSPNYQVLASLDVGRRQVELEGYGLVQRQLELAMTLRDRIAEHPLLSKYFRVLGSGDLIPDRYRVSGHEDPLRLGPVAMEEAWSTDEFVLDPCRLTIEISATGIDGDTFKHAQLMDRWGIQINKTTRNTVLAMTNIGTTRSALAHLLRALIGIAEELEAELGQMSPEQRRAFDLRADALAHDHPPLPDFSRFHAAFRADPAGEAGDGDMRKAYYMAYREELGEFVSPAEARRRVEAGLPVVSTIFVTPYPPGFPILVPGQEFSKDILDFMDALDTKEIHGFDPVRGYRVFVESALAVDGDAPQEAA
ncbi:aminotransferase class I/II-fold pyridoxal phosphate-dependent enzyme [Kitasatospora sp. NPDC096204]|uniref:aminotransferase class I/II-fold pyridoxal phosphate-dependent enzyme n=1 Tax=Kitasatospora sp. NPDC096204 TaxID=3364094 RepID=UPI003828921B